MFTATVQGAFVPHGAGDAPQAPTLSLLRLSATSFRATVGNAVGVTAWLYYMHTGSASWTKVSRSGNGVIDVSGLVSSATYWVMAIAGDNELSEPSTIQIIPLADPVTSGLLLGYECKLYRNAGTYENEDWQEILPVKDVTLNLEKGEVDATTRDNDGWKAVRGALKSGSVDFEIVWDPTDAGFQALLDSFISGTPVEFAIMDGLMVAPGSQGLRATMEVLKFPRSEPLEGLVTAAVTIKPTRADNAPEWITVAD